MVNDKIQIIADNADMIVNGYAFTRDDAFIRVFNIKDGISSMVISDDGTMLETNMDDIQQAIVKRIWNHDSKYMEDSDAKVL